MPSPDQPRSPTGPSAYAYDRWRPRSVRRGKLERRLRSPGRRRRPGRPTSGDPPATRSRRGVRSADPPRARRPRPLVASRRHAPTDDTSSDHGERSSRTPLARAAGRRSRAHTYGYSISPERRRDASAAPRSSRRQRLGSAGDATTFTADARGYLPGFGAASRRRAACRRRSLVERRCAPARIVSPRRRRRRACRRHRFRQRRVQPAARLSGGQRSPAPTSRSRTPTTACRSRGRSAASARWPLFLHTVHAAAVRRRRPRVDRRSRARRDVKTSRGRRALGRSRRRLLVAVHGRPSAPRGDTTAHAAIAARAATCDRARILSANLSETAIIDGA